MSKRTVAILVWIALASLGVGVVLFPHAADWFALRSQAGTVARHSQDLASASAADLDHLVSAAEEYNRQLAAGLRGFTNHHHPEYLSHLRVGETDLMATVTIPSLDLTVPVHHGTTDDVLYRGAGHQYGTSLPIGGPDTHAVITAHSGLMRARLFTHLGNLQVGEAFFVSTLGRHAWYQVDQIATVLPGDYHAYLAVVPGQDLVTLFTCTPVGVNSHRLLVRGHRIEAPAGGELFASEHTLAAGFPWWSLVMVGTMTIAGGTGKMLFAPPQRRPAHRIESRGPRHA
ncbi:MAG: class C sortase [Promicromonosporaceae bacterium]|nr:class C sortase [Promicromonosporaceae bacterium]